VGSACGKNWGVLERKTPEVFLNQWLILKESMLSLSSTRRLLKTSFVSCGLSTQKSEAGEQQLEASLGHIATPYLKHKPNQRIVFASLASEAFLFQVHYILGTLNIQMSQWLSACDSFKNHLGSSKSMQTAVPWP
jgi:hypothetical protein